MKHVLRFTAAAVAVLVLAGLARGWWVIGHGIIADAAVAGLPDDMPPFFREAGKQLAHLAGDPDRWKNPKAPHLRAAESPDHFIDLENYQGKDLPADRWKAIALLTELKQDPEKAGMLPYAILENYERLAAPSAITARRRTIRPCGPSASSTPGCCRT